MRRFVARRSIALSILSLACAAACSRETQTPAPKPAAAASAPRVELAIYAATSTRDALQALEAQYESEQTIDLVFNFGSSGDLSKQIVAAAKADAFLSADEKEMDKVEAAQLVAAGSRQDLLSNQLVVVEPVDAPSIFTTPFAPQQLAHAGVKRLSLGSVETVPAGRYAKAWLEKTGVWSSVSDRVLPGVDVRAALAAVESASAQAGIVYRTDVVRSKKARIVFAVPLEDGPQIRYPVAAIAGRPQEKRARAFVDWLTCPSAQKTFEAHGFVFLAAAVGSCR